MRAYSHLGQKDETQSESSCLFLEDRKYWASKDSRLKSMCKADAQINIGNAEEYSLARHTL